MSGSSGVYGSIHTAKHIVRGRSIAGGFKAMLSARKDIIQSSHQTIALREKPLSLNVRHSDREDGVRPAWEAKRLQKVSAINIFP